MLHLVLYGLLAVVVAVGLFLIATRFLPAGEQIAPPLRDEPPWDLPPDRTLQAADVDAVRLPVALRGYRFAETDLLLDRLATELRTRDEEIARLRDRAPLPAADDPAVRPAGPRTSRPTPTPRPMSPSRGRTRRMPTDPERSRCGWATSAPEYVAYHDDEWGVPLHGENQLFERLSLEAFQSGLSWLVILRKRPAFRTAFAGFDVDAVARFGAADVTRLLADAGIVRNRAKIEATIANARAVRENMPEGLDALLWSYAPAARRRRPETLADVPSTAAESVALAKELKRRGFRFVGPTTAYAAMQATGIVDDHIATCWRATR